MCRKNRQNCPCDQSIEQEDDVVPDFPNRLIDILKNGHKNPRKIPIEPNQYAILKLNDSEFEK